MYVLYNQKYYLMQNTIKQWIPTTDLDKAFKFRDKTKAKNAILNLPKQTRNLGYQVMELEEEVYESVDFSAFTNPDLVDYDEALTQIDEFCSLHDRLVAKVTWVEYKLNEVENKIQDVLHAIEFNSYNARDGYKIYKLLHDLRLERRKYKDEQIIADILRQGFKDADWNRVKLRVNDLKGRDYTARSLKELFE